MNSTSYRKIQVECPICHKVSSFPIFDSIEITDVAEKTASGQPSIWKRASSGTLFIFKCGQCGYREPMTYQVTCLDSVNNALISVVEGDDRANERMTTQLFQQTNSEAPEVICRIVETTDELSEKLRLFNDNLDDRTFELLRFIMESQVKQEAYEKEMPYEDITCSYKGIVNGTIYFAVKGYESELIEMSAPSELYYKLSEIVPDATNFYRIDREWAQDVIAERNGN